MDAGSVRRAQACSTNDADADGEVVWSWRPDAGVKPAGRLAGDGGKRARSPRRARRKPLKPLRGESRLIPSEPVVTTLVCFFILHARLRVQRAPGFPCALCFWASGSCTNSGASRRERAAVRPCTWRGPSFETLASQASQDEVERLGAKSDPHGEEAHRAVSNHEAPG